MPVQCLALDAADDCGGKAHVIGWGGGFEDSANRVDGCAHVAAADDTSLAPFRLFDTRE
jgi:hypothetical protein